ncbi:MAG: hypothetical protein J6A77_10845 [Lachnospiraceae bacterium]|nr:hypothetical protein [Lachnospiraceae bacterium]
MKKDITLPLLTIGHFTIDLACLYFYFTYFPQCGLVAGISAALFYNFLAFALQAPIGCFFDRFPARKSTSIGILFVLIGYICGFCRLYAAGLMLCGFGNAFYHVGGSIGIARIDAKGLRNSGIFVSAGALGVSLGTFLASGPGLSDLRRQAVTVFLVLFLLILLVLQKRVRSSRHSALSPLPVKTTALLLLLSLLAVFIRSFGGLFFPSSYRLLFTLPGNGPLAIFLLAMASGITAFLGKFMGGFLSNVCTAFFRNHTSWKSIDSRSGNYLSGILTLGISTLLLTFGGNISLLCFLGILFFHAAMPVTLFELYCILPDHPGFAMGLSTVMLFLGYLPSTWIPPDTLPDSLILCLLTLLATGCMAAAFLLYRRSRT